MTIKLNLKSATLEEGQTVKASSLIASHTNSHHRALTEYAVYLNGADGGRSSSTAMPLPTKSGSR